MRDTDKYIKLAGKFYLEYFDDQPDFDRCDDKCCVAQKTTYGTRYYQRSILPRSEALLKFSRYIGAY